jgi:CheY-like chemotaxis protein
VCISTHPGGAPPPPSRRRPDLPSIVDRLILRGLAKKSRERYLSCEDMRAAVAAVAGRLRPTEPTATTPRVLIVDDDADFRAFVCTFVRRLSPDCSLYTAQDGSEALHVAKRVQPHLAVLDLNMPEMDGLELAERLSESPETQRTRLVVVSGGAAAEKRERFEQLGVARIFDKPLHPIPFMQTVQTLLSQAA